MAPVHMAEKPSSISNTRASTDLGGMIHRGRTHPSRIGLNPAVTKAAVDLQNLSLDNMDETVAAALDSLREVTGCDCICIAQLSEDGATIEKINYSINMLAGCRPDGLAELAMRRDAVDARPSAAHAADRNPRHPQHR